MHKYLLSTEEIKCYYEISKICQQKNNGKIQEHTDKVIHALYENLIQTVESINLLVKEKKYITAKSLFRKCIEIGSNLNCIMEHPKSANIIRDRAMLLNAFTLQQYMHRIKLLYDKVSDSESKDSIESSINELSPLIGYNFSSVDEALEHFTIERDNRYKNKKGKKNLWFTGCTDLESKHEFIDKYGEIAKSNTSFLYNLQSEDIHGTGVLLSLNTQSFNSFSRQEWIILLAINKLLEKPTDNLLTYNKARKKCEVQIQYLVKKYDEKQKYMNALK